MKDQPLTRHELANLVERQAESFVAALRGPEEAVAATPASSKLRAAPWTKVGEEEDQSYSWPEGVEHYSPFEIWQTVDERGSIRIGLGRVTEPKFFYGRERYWWLAFEMLGGEKSRPIVVFNETDDHEASGDLVAVIKGKGKGGRSMFAPGDELPDYYDDLRVETFKKRIAGPPAMNRLAVVAANEDRQAMLDHALAQLRLRL